MKHIAAPCLLALVGSLALAQAASQDHATHHPAQAASAPVAAPAATSPGGQASAPEEFTRQMQLMQDMHKRMQAASTPAEKQALMGEHLKLMQSGTEMMSRMGQGSGPMGMGGMGGAPSTGKPGEQAGPGAMGGMHGMMAMHGSMERRMAMMEQMMQMLVDREAAMPRR